MAITYASPSDLQRLSVRSTFLQTVREDEQLASLEAASDLVDSYLRSRFVMPLKTWGQDIVRCVCILARYDLAVRRGYNPEAGADTNLRQQYEDCIAWLQAVVNEDVTPSLTDSNSGGTENSTFVKTSSQRGWSQRGTGVPPAPFEGD